MSQLDRRPDWRGTWSIHPPFSSSLVAIEPSRCRPSTAHCRSSNDKCAAPPLQLLVFATFNRNFTFFLCTSLRHPRRQQNEVIQTMIPCVKHHLLSTLLSLLRLGLVNLSFCSRVLRNRNAAASVKDLPIKIRKSCPLYPRLNLGLS